MVGDPFNMNVTAADRRDLNSLGLVGHNAARPSTAASRSARTPSARPLSRKFISNSIVSVDPGSSDNMTPQQSSTSSMTWLDGVVTLTAVVFLFGFFLDARTEFDASLPR